MASNGFSVLLWCKAESSLLERIDPTRQHAVLSRETMERELLQDAACLLGCRWSMNVTLDAYDNILYAYGTNNRITVSNATIHKALGDLNEHVDFIRSTPNTDFETLARYQRCRRKWNVPDQVSDTSSGWGDTESATTSVPTKRRRY